MAKQETGLSQGADVEQAQLSRAVAQLQADIDKLIGKHRNEIHRSLRTWSQSQQEDQSPAQSHDWDQTVLTISEKSGPMPGLEHDSPTKAAQPPSGMRSGAQHWQEEPPELATQGSPMNHQDAFKRRSVTQAWAQPRSQDRLPLIHTQPTADSVIFTQDRFCGSPTGTLEPPDSPTSPSPIPPSPRCSGTRLWSKPQEYTVQGAEQRFAHPTHTLTQAWSHPQDSSTHPSPCESPVDRGPGRRGSGAKTTVSNVSVVPCGKNGMTQDKSTATATSSKSDFSKKAARRSSVRPGEFITSHKRELAEVQKTPLQRLISNQKFEVFTGVLICSNAVFLGLITQYSAHHTQANALEANARGLNEVVHAELPLGFAVTQVLFTLAFTIDLGLRWGADGFMNFFRTRDVGWNIFDMVVVSTSFLDILTLVAPNIDGKGMFSNSTILRVMRVMRIVRVARVIRVLPFFRELRMMVFALLNSAKNLLWVFMILGLLFFIVGISLTSATMDHLCHSEEWAAEENQALITAFGSLDNAVLSLFMSMSGGKDWADYYDLLEPLPAQQKIIFLAYISFANFAVVNIVTGIFVDCAMQSNQNDREVMVQEEMAQKNKYLSDMRVVFEEIDDDRTGTIELEEFQRKMDDERVLSYFKALKMNVEDIHKLFRLLDTDQSGSIDIDEFIKGCHRLKGESRALDMAIMHFEIQWLSDNMLIFQEKVESCLEQLIEDRH